MKIDCIQTGPFGVNTYIVEIEDNKCFIVDPAACRFTRDTEKFSAYLDSSGLEPVAIVLTHGHFDHVSGLKFLREKYPEIEIYIHNDDAPMIGHDSEKMQGPGLESMGFDVFVEDMEINKVSADNVQEYSKEYFGDIVNYTNIFDDYELDKESRRAYFSQYASAVLATKGTIIFKERFDFLKNLCLPYYLWVKFYRLLKRIFGYRRTSIR